MAVSKVAWSTLWRFVYARSLLLGPLCLASHLWHDDMEPDPQDKHFPHALRCRRVRQVARSSREERLHSGRLHVCASMQPRIAATAIDLISFYTRTAPLS